MLSILKINTQAQLTKFRIVFAVFYRMIETTEAILSALFKVRVD